MQHMSPLAPSMSPFGLAGGHWHKEWRSSRGGVIIQVGTQLSEQREQQVTYRNPERACPEDIRAASLINWPLQGSGTSASELISGMSVSSSVKWK